MTTTYTMFIENAFGNAADAVVARGVTLSRAIVLALEYGDRGKAALVYSDIGQDHHFAIGRRLPNGGAFDCATHTVVRRSGNTGLDADRAIAVFEQVLLQHPHEFWNVRVMPDEEFARRHVH